MFRTTGFALEYDGLNRLRSFATATGSMAENVDYDLNTNPVAVRRSYQSNMTTDAVLSYDGNRLTGVSDVSSDAKMGTVPQIAAGDYADAIAYDAVGRPVRDDMRGITSISYHRSCNRPKRIEFGSKGRLDFDYMPDGRLRAQTYSRAAVRSAVRVPGGLGPAAGDSVPAVRDSSRFEAAIVPVSERRFYGSYERVDGQMRVNTGFGHYSFADSVHRWYVKDWKGSVRHTAYRNKATGKMSFGQHTFVYPSGLPVITSNPGNIDRFHQDKRWIEAEGLDMYDNQARMYDPVYVRFTTPDEMAEEFRGHSPWAYCAGNVIAYRDPSGYFSIEEITVGFSNAAHDVKDELERKLDNVINGDNNVLTSLALTTEFLIGIGPERRSFGPDHPFTKELKESHLTTVCLDVFYTEYQSFLEGNRDFPNSYRVDFGPGKETGPIRGLMNDGGNITTQFIGTATYNFELGSDNVLNITVFDSKTEYSLLYHAPGTDRHQRSEQRIMGETFQVYTFSMTMDEVRRRATNE